MKLNIWEGAPLSYRGPRYQPVTSKMKYVNRIADRIIHAAEYIALDEKSFIAQILDEFDVPDIDAVPSVIITNNQGQTVMDHRDYDHYLLTVNDLMEFFKSVKDYYLTLKCNIRFYSDDWNKLVPKEVKSCFTNIKNIVQSHRGSSQLLTDFDLKGSTLNFSFNIVNMKSSNEDELRIAAEDNSFKFRQARELLETYAEMAIRQVKGMTDDHKFVENFMKLFY